MSAEREITCSIERTLGVLGERWAILIIREAFFGSTRFAEFRAALGVAPDVLADRLAGLVAAGVLDKRPYQEPGQRARESYHLTEAGDDLILVLGALQQWGDEHLPRTAGPSMLRRNTEGQPLSVGFVDPHGAPVDRSDVVFVSAATGDRTSP